MSWRAKAACLDEDPELFFPPGTTSPAALEQAERAKAVCARCPVKAACLAFALASRQDFGVWGGVDEDERRGLRRACARSRQRSADSARQGTP